MKTWVKLLLGVTIAVIALFLLARPDLQYTYWSGVAVVPVALCFTLALRGDECAVAVKRLAKERRQKAIRRRSQLTLAEWGRKYGPPVVTPVRKPEALPASRLPLHVCGGKAYAAERYCPVHGYVWVQPGLEGVISESLPVSIAPSVSGSPIIGGSMSSDEFARQVARAAEESYVPEGSTELWQNLVETLRDQAAEAVKGSHWEMNTEWAAEVKKLKAIDGNGNRGPLWKPRTRVMPAGYPSEYLLGFPVRVSDEYGAPSLEGP
jgi:hypothetical protein